MIEVAIPTLRLVQNKPMQATAKEIGSELRQLANPEDAAVLQRFFKTGKGDYGEGDVFLGIRVPQTRRLARRFRGTGLPEMLALLQSEYHEARLLALLMMVDLFQPSEPRQQEEIYRAYLANTARINNWDLVDSSAHKIVGPWLLDRSHAPLFRLAKSSNLWERRIGLLATFHFIALGRFDTSLAIADLLLDDPHDLIHKAVGWMLREIGKRNLAAEEAFLTPRYPHMPRTMLRYAIEKFPETKRQDYLKGKI
ncbi:DNA alkylation repair protein [Pontiella sp.]|uniref:DNA alkylation repair protein n=1 Tax=Pontiella sp. TaxID=2837462 RepID=UPI003569D7B4